MEEALKDERFKCILSDPRFRRMPKNVRKIKVDKRFKQMFKDKKFKEKCALDMRGRPIDITPSENLKKLYNVTSESSEEEDELVGHDEVDKSNEIKSSQDHKPKKETQKIKKQNADEAVAATKNARCSGFDLEVRSQNDDVLKNKKAKSKRNEYIQKDNSVSKSKLNEEKDFSENTDFEISVPKEAQDKKSKSSLQLQDCSEDNEEKFQVKPDLQNSYESLNESEESDSSEQECTSESESEETDNSESEGSAETGEFDHRWEELREDAPDTDEITRRLAVCNMDWDRIRAEDLFAVFDSFKPADGCINSVKIYPSEYGLKRMEEEKLHGPPELVEEILDPDEEEVEDKKTSKYHREKLRQYQINRLKYYYAVIDCDSPNTANILYEQLNGMEYESSSVRFDIRFIPDDVTFDYEPTSVADKIPDPTEYKPRLFVTTALQQVKVNLTWDETDPKRRETLQKAFTEPDSIERDIKDYLASSSSESEVEINGDEEGEESENNKISTKKRIEKYKALLQSLEEKEKQDEDKYEMEITWEPGLKEKTEEIVKEKIEKVSLNPFEEMLKKKKEQRKLRKKEQKMSNYEISNKDHSASEESGEEFFSKKKPAEKKMEERDVKQLAELSLLSDSHRKDIIVENASKKKKEKKKSRLHESEDFKCDVNDPRFSAIYTSHLFNIDPSDPHFKKTEGNLALIQEKQKKLKHKGSYNDTQRNVKKAKYF